MFQFRVVGRRQTKLRIGGVLVAALMLMTPASSRADHIDDELVKNAEKMVKTLQEKGIKNVGVIKFLVRRGKDELNANVGPINLNMATRVENALILGLDQKQPLGIIHDATQVSATADPKMSVRSAAARAALFKPMYPLAWGKDKVTADAFITGTIDLSPDMKTTKVDIGYFMNKDGEKIQSLLSFTVATDRSILSDAGQSFALGKRSLAKKRSLEELDEEAATSAASGDNGKPITTQPDAENPLKFEIRYDGVAQTISPDGGSGEMTVPTPQKGQVVTFVMTNTSSERIGVVLKINGESALGQEINEDSACQKWVLAPGKEYTLKGFYSQTDNTVAIFKVLDDDESAARLAEWAGKRPRAGFVDVAVFREAKEAVEEDMTYSRGKLRGLSLPQQKKSHPDSALAANKLVKDLTKTGKTNRGLIVEGDTKETANLSEAEMKNTTQVFNMQINYYKPATP